MMEIKKINMKIKNKKAEGLALLGGYTVNIVIAVLAIIVLLYLGYRVFGVFSDKSELEKAQDNINAFALEYNEFISLEEEKHDFIILGPKDWWFTSYPKKDKPSPEICDDYEYCVCVCKYGCHEEMVACAEIDKEFKIEGGLGYILDEIPYKLSLKNLAG